MRLLLLRDAEGAARGDAAAYEGGVRYRPAAREEGEGGEEGGVVHHCGWIEDEDGEGGNRKGNRKGNRSMRDGMGEIELSTGGMLGMQYSSETCVGFPRYSKRNMDTVIGCCSALISLRLLHQHPNLRTTLGYTCSKVCLHVMPSNVFFMPY